MTKVQSIYAYYDGIILFYYLSAKNVKATEADKTFFKSIFCKNNTNKYITLMARAKK